MDVCVCGACFLKSRDPLNNLLYMCTMFIYIHKRILLAKCYLEKVNEQWKSVAFFLEKSQLKMRYLLRKLFRIYMYEYMVHIKYIIIMLPYICRIALYKIVYLHISFYTARSADVWTPRSNLLTAGARISFLMCESELINFYHFLHYFFFVCGLRMKHKDYYSLCMCVVE